MNQIRLFIMSESQGMRRGLAAIFASDKSFDIIGEDGCEEESFVRAQQLQPDVILYGLKPGEDTAAMILKIKEACPYTKIFVFITNNTGDEVRAAINAGIDGCISETMLPCHLVKAVELTCKAGVMCLPWSLKRLLKQNEPSPGCGTSTENNNGAGTANCETNLILPLTAREVEIYKLIVHNYSNKEIGKKLYISQPTVKTHVSSILRKLGLNNRTELILFEVQHKYLMYLGDANHEKALNEYKKSSSNVIQKADV